MYNNAVDFYVSYLLDPHEVKTNKKQGNSIFWVKDGKIIAEIEESKDFWLRYDICMSISRMFSFNDYETRSVIKIWLKQNHGLAGLTPYALIGWGSHTHVDN